MKEKDFTCQPWRTLSEETKRKKGQKKKIKREKRKKVEERKERKQKRKKERKTEGKMTRKKKEKDKKMVSSKPGTEQMGCKTARLSATICSGDPLMTV